MNRNPVSRKANRSFWILVGVAVLATGALSKALMATPSPLTGIRVAASGLILLAAVALAARVMIALVRAQRQTQRT